METNRKEKKKFQLLLLPGPFVSVRTSLIFLLILETAWNIVMRRGSQLFQRACVLVCVSTDGCHCMRAGLHIHVMEAEEPRRHM